MQEREAAALLVGCLPSRQQTLDLTSTMKTVQREDAEAQGYWVVSDGLRSAGAAHKIKQS